MEDQKQPTPSGIPDILRDHGGENSLDSTQLDTGVKTNEKILQLSETIAIYLKNNHLRQDYSKQASVIHSVKFLLGNIQFMYNLYIH